MESKISVQSPLPNRNVVGLAKEMNRFEEWLAAPDAPTQLFFISGIGGIGKTTLLTEMAYAARRSAVPALWLEGRGELSTSVSFLSGLEISLETELGRLRKQDMPLLPYVISELSRQQTVLIVDNCDTIDRIEGWLLSSFLPKLESGRVLVVMASRNGLPLKWRTNPYWGRRIHSFPLRLLTRREVHDYLRESGLEPSVQKDIAQKTEGHPLLLALTVDLLRSQEWGTQNKLSEIPGMLSAELLREAATPPLYHALTVLALLPSADLETLNRLLEMPLDSSGYRALSSMSFVHSTPQGLSLPHIVSRLVREDYMQRSWRQYQLLRQQVFKLLAEQFHAVDKRRQMHIADHALELYRECLPSAHAYADFSSILKLGEHQPYQEQDLPYLHRFLAASLSHHPSVWQSELVRAQDYHPLLDDIARHSSDSICVVRDDSGLPLAFCAGFRLHRLTLPLLERYAAEFLPILGEEEHELRHLPPEASDTICVLLAAVDVEHPLYQPEELGALLMRQWLISMTSGLRGIMVSADRQLNALLSSLGFEEKGRLRVEAAPEAALTVGEMDFRQITFVQWIHKIIRQTGPAGASRTLTLAPDHADTTISTKDTKLILQHLFHGEKLGLLPVVRQLHLSGAEIQQCVQHILTAEQPLYPLTKLEQSILRESFLQKDQNKNQLAERFHMSRTTFYRHTRLAIDKLAQVLARFY